MKRITIVVLAVLTIAFAGFADAATPKKRTRNANRVGAYGGALIGYSTYGGDQSQTEQELEDFLASSGAPIQGEVFSGTEESDIGYQAMFGYRFHRYFAAELGLAQYGSLVSKANADLDFGQGFVPTSVALKFSAGGPVVSAIGILPLNNNFEFFARLGYLFASAQREFSARVDGESAGGGSAHGESQNPVYGVGFAWHINQVYSIRGEYQRLDSLGEKNQTGKEDVTVMGLGLIVRF